MNKLERLALNFSRQVSLPWDDSIAGPQRVWFAVYDPVDERRLRAQLGEFEIATKQHRHGWHVCDLTDLFPEWISKQEYREAFFSSPEDMVTALPELREFAAQHVKTSLASAKENDVVAVIGSGALFGLLHVSDLVRDVETSIRGRMLVLFPGTFEKKKNNYRLLDARDGWNYLAVPITAEDGDLSV